VLRALKKGGVYSNPQVRGERGTGQGNRTGAGEGFPPFDSKEGGRVLHDVYMYVFLWGNTCVYDKTQENR